MPDPVFEAEHDDVLGRAFDRRLAAPAVGDARGRITGWCGPRSRCSRSSPLVELAQPYLLKVAIDDHILHRRLGRVWRWWPGSTRPVLVVLYALRMVEAYLMALTGQRVIHDLRARSSRTC